MENEKMFLSIQDAVNFSKGLFNRSQLVEILWGFTDGLRLEQIKIYSNPKFSCDRMWEIRNGFKDGLNWEQIKKYVNSDFDLSSVKEIKYDLEKRDKIIINMQDAVNFSRGIFNSLQMAQILWGFDDGLNFEQVKSYSNSDFSHEEMSKMRLDFREF